MNTPRIILDAFDTPAGDFFAGYGACLIVQWIGRKLDDAAERRKYLRTLGQR